MKQRQINVCIWTTNCYGISSIMKICRMMRYIGVNYRIKDAEMINDVHLSTKIEIFPYNRETARKVDEFLNKANERSILCCTGM